jgi:hypothetical protein
VLEVAWEARVYIAASAFGGGTGPAKTDEHKTFTVCEKDDDDADAMHVLARPPARESCTWRRIITQACEERLAFRWGSKEC